MYNQRFLKSGSYIIQKVAQELCGLSAFESFGPHMDTSSPQWDLSINIQMPSPLQEISYFPLVRVPPSSRIRQAAAQLSNKSSRGSDRQYLHCQGRSVRNLKHDVCAASIYLRYIQSSTLFHLKRTTFKASAHHPARDGMYCIYGLQIVWRIVRPYEGWIQGWT